jgi:signal transduction histidine kinase
VLVSRRLDPEELMEINVQPHRQRRRYARRSVAVTAAPGPDVIAVEITDDGPGIPASQRQRVFDRFVRLDPSREHASGSAGLGLAIAREIAAAHGATIELTEAESRGVRAVVTLSE